MPNPFSEASYLALPKLSPYIDHERFERPKEVFKHVARKLESITDASQSYRLMDIACGNGEMLYFLKQKFPKWNLAGADFTEDFIRCGRAFPGLAGVDLRLADFYEIEEKFDVVTCIGTMHSMWEIEPPLEKLLGMVEPGGHLIVDGCFNPDDVEVRMAFMDESKPEGRGKWRRDFSQHSRRAIGRFLEAKCESYDFEDVEMGVEVPRKPEAPHCNVWTFKDEQGRNHLTNGSHMILDKTLLTVRIG